MPSPRLDAVAVTSTNLAATAAFYRLLGFTFPAIGEEDKHLEAVTPEGAVRLMIDTAELMEELTGEVPRPATHSAFALVCDSPGEVDTIAAAIGQAGHRIVTEPWDAFWGQRYATVADPDGYRIDLFAALPAT